MLCLFNGFASEVFAPAFPLIGRRKSAGPRLLKAFAALRRILLAISVLFTIYWVLRLLGASWGAAHSVVATAELSIYLVGELLAAMFLWIAFTGRGYCYYCPLGTVLAGIARLAGQKIVTDRTRCIRCGACNEACALSIDVQRHAEKAIPVVDTRCVGCGHCVDACPTRTLCYSTAFIDRRRRVRGR